MGEFPQRRKATEVRWQHSGPIAGTVGALVGGSYWSGAIRGAMDYTGVVRRTSQAILSMNP